MKIITIIGARPQFIKAAPFSDFFRKNHIEILVHTGQHYDANMSEVFFKELKIPNPDYNLEIGSGSHGRQTGRMMEQIEKVVLSEMPDGVLVYGDTNSTLAGALVASKLNVPVYHVEAGLRSYNRLMPEEKNRVLTDHISDLLLCPTQTAVNNLEKEGVISGVINTGDIMYDAVLRNIDISRNKYKNNSCFSCLEKENGFKIDIHENEYYLATIHRAENTDDPTVLKKIFTAFENLDKRVLLPIHPRTRKLIDKLYLNIENVIIIDPVGYLTMLHLIANAYMVVTDSGGLQKEAYFLKTPCTTLRSQTEWVETLNNGWNKLSSTEVNVIIENINRKLDCKNYVQPMLFGDGHASEHITNAILSSGRKTMFND